jgi:hypothetical protein
LKENSQNMSASGKRHQTIPVLASDFKRLEQFHPQFKRPV